MAKGVGLISGGLDSILAVKVLQDQNIDIIGVSFVTPFFSSEKAENASKYLNIDLRILDITDIHIEMIQSPRHGYGKGMNPCIDCHALMFNIAGKLMETEKADFLFSGEVLGERPMSQNFRSLMMVSDESGYGDFIIRPLSAKLLPETRPEREGKVDRERLLDISGRSRKPQIELAEYYGIKEYAQPAGGCLLTDKGYSKRLKDLITNNPDFDRRDIDLLTIGRQFRLKTGEKVIVGRDQKDNEKLMSMKRDNDVIIDLVDYPSPIVMIPNGGSQEAIALSASICVTHSDAPNNENVNVIYSLGGDEYYIRVKAISRDELDSIRI
jgi:tRNA U34 2-thiouridine synthase MnmA/TrmU